MQTNGKIKTLALALMFPLCASAGTKISNQSDKQGQLHNLFIQDGKVATVDEKGRAQFIFDNNKQEITILQHDNKHYIQLDQASLAAMAGGLAGMRNQAMSMMQQQMAGMSAEQRQQMEKMMGSMMPSAPAKKPSAKLLETSRNDKVNGVSCSWIEVHQEGKKVSEACVAKLKDTALDKEDFHTLQGFFAVIEKVASEFAGAGATADMQLNQLMFNDNRVPLKLRDQRNNQAEDINLKFDSASFDGTLFTVPKGYRLQSMPTMTMPGN